MPDHFKPDEVRTCEQIQDIIRSSFYPGALPTFSFAVKSSWARLKCTSIAEGHAWVNLWVEPLQTQLGEKRGRKVGKFLSIFVPLFVSLLFASASLYLVSTFL